MTNEIGDATAGQEMVEQASSLFQSGLHLGVAQFWFGVRELRDTAGEILPVPPLLKEGTQKPPFVKGAARSAGGFGNVAVMKRTFASSIALLPLSAGEAVLRPFVARSMASGS